ncbi:MAG TPA: sulfur carrier protein ThiS [Bacteroidales bacterium]|nr:sulfur carrier protein ThiS [Bacteroidales bacterium]
MKILLNNKEEQFDTGTLTVTRMLEIKKFTYRMRIVKINGNLIPRERYDDALIKDGDNVQMIYLMSGG